MSDAPLPGFYEIYLAELEHNRFVRDPAQDEVARRLAVLAERLVAAGPRPRGRIPKVLKGGHIEPERGLYIWGDTGRGKTWLVDLFYENLAVANKSRRHFHRFMAAIHETLGRLKHQRDPVDTVAQRLAEATRVLCFDEFYVSDIADAMILGRLFRGLFRRGVTLVATSNTAPDELYRDGLQRSQFLPAIELIEEHCEVLHMDGGTDYRLRTLERAEIYHSPADADANANLLRYFGALAPEACHRDEALTVSRRRIPTVLRADGVVWFKFRHICDGPRSQTDYIEIARGFHTVIVEGVPRFDETKENQARRFIALVDEFYDRNVKLILAAEVPMTALYAGDKLAFEFRRTYSRLEEMQSREYLARPHLP